MSWLSKLFGGGGKSSSPSQPDYPSYQPSPYDASSSKAINDFYSPRIKGENLGLDKEDQSQLEAQAIDFGNYTTNEYMRRGAAGRRMTGGMTTGGMDNLREDALNAGLRTRSQAMRDVAVQNALLKHTDQWNAASGMQNFLNSERSHSYQVYNANMAPYQLNAMGNYYSADPYRAYTDESNNQNATAAVLAAINLFSKYGGKGG